MNWNYKGLVKNVPHKHKYMYNEKDEKRGVVVILNNGSFGWSICSKKDTFNKLYGRAIAILRAQSGKTHLGNVPSPYWASQIVSKLDALGAKI